MRKGAVLMAVCLMGMAAAGAALTGQGKKAHPDRGYPEKAVTVICPWVRDGGTDLALRALCRSAQKELGVPVNVVNKAGESGVIGFNAIRNAPSDGYTLGMITYELNSLPWEGSLDYTYEDMEPLIMVNADAVALAAHGDAPYNTIPELVEYAREHPGDITVALSSPGCVWQVGTAMFADMADIDLTFLPFEGTANAVTAASNGYTEAVAASVAEVTAQVEAGNLKILGIMDRERAPLYPQVPTFGEQGYDVTYYTWRGLALPKGVGGEKRAVLEQAFSAAMEDEDFVKEMKAKNLNITWMDAETFRAFLERNYKEVGQTLKGLGMLK